jgi:hydroxypyruvate reductase
LLKEAQPDALAIFLVSGGGSAMFELPVNDDITLDDLRNANQQLVSSGASINEINAVRRALSAVKGGKLAAVADIDQITLIVSDTNPGDFASVASGPTMQPGQDAPLAAEVVKRFGLDDSLPKAILKAISHPVVELPSTKRLRAHHVLLDNNTALAAAAAEATRLGFAVETATEINEQDISQGCDLLLARAGNLSRRFKGQDVCLLSGGEFSCPVRGDGVGGRNVETVLRCALKLEASSLDGDCLVWSAGTDGRDGNSPAAGAVADQTTMTRALKKGLNANSLLGRSDSFHFFEPLGDLLITGRTGTNVRDIRIMLIGSAMGSRASRPQ